MLSVASLWLPIVLAAVLVFVASSLIHMVLKYHASDYRALPNEDAVRAAIRAANLPPGQYFFPHVGDMKRMGEPDVVAKFVEGPVGHVTLRKAGPPTMGPNLAQWFVFILVVNLVAGYIAGVALGPGVDYMPVFRIVSTVSVMGYGLGAWQTYIWGSKPLRNVLLSNMDGLIYALFTAGVFGWLWPK